MNIITYKLPYIASILQQIGLKASDTLRLEDIKRAGNSVIILKEGTDFLLIPSPYKIGVSARPVIISELLTKIKGFEINNANIKLQEHITFNPKSQLINIKDISIELTDKETSVLLYLYQHIGQIISKNDLLRNIWNHKEELDTKTLEAHIYRLRSKLGEFKDIIQAKEGGYVLVI